MSRNFWFRVAGVPLVVALAGFGLVRTLTAGSAADLKPLPGTAMLSGTVKASKPFQAAQVYAMNTDKNILVMVYTSGGRYAAPHMLPGNYDVSARKKGLASDVRKITVRPGENATLDLMMQDTPAEARQSPSSGGSTAQEVRLVSHDELYPPGPGREALLKNCVYCHGPNFFPSRQMTAEQWTRAITLMTNGNASQGPMVPPGTLSQTDREAIHGYLAKNFGPGSVRRALRVDVDFPVDERVLAQAMYVEYYLPLDPKLDANNKSRRAQEPHFDPEGNVWYTDRIIPNRIGRVDPRTGDIKDFVLPDPKADPHGLTVDDEGHVWWAETVGFHLGRLDPKTGKMTRYPMDSSGRYQGRGHTPITDSQGNVWYSVIGGDMIGKWDRKTEKTTVWKVPTEGAAPYGITRDQNDNLWFAEFRRCKIARFDPATQDFTEYAAPTQPCTIRRLSVDSKGTVWYGSFSNGILGKLDPKTGKIVEYKIPLPFSEPYDTWPDRDGNIWVSDDGQGGALLKFDPRTEKFTYYPTPQRGDQPKLAITRDGAIWYTPRSAPKAAAGVLYPDVSKITTLAAHY
jgi:virginiamycin B lyase